MEARTSMALVKRPTMSVVGIAKLGRSGIGGTVKRVLEVVFSRYFPFVKTT
jgi:hypothetical protein